MEVTTVSPLLGEGDQPHPFYTLPAFFRPMPSISGGHPSPVVEGMSASWQTAIGLPSSPPAWIDSIDSLSVSSRLYTKKWPLRGQQHITAPHRTSPHTARRGLGETKTELCSLLDLARHIRFEDRLEDMASLGHEVQHLRLARAKKLR